MSFAELRWRCLEVTNLEKEDSSTVWLLQASKQPELQCTLNITIFVAIHAAFWLVATNFNSGPSIGEMLQINETRWPINNKMKTESYLWRRFLWKVLWRWRRCWASWPCWSDHWWTSSKPPRQVSEIIWPKSTTEAKRMPNENSWEIGAQLTITCTLRNIGGR